MMKTRQALANKTVPKPGRRPPIPLTPRQRIQRLGRAARKAPAELPSLLPHDRDQPTADNTWSHPEQRKLLEHFKTGGYCGLVSRLGRLENISPNSAASRLTGHEWKDDGLMLLSNVDEEDLKSILSNTYVSDAIAYGWRQPTHRKVDEDQTLEDPSIYFNSICPADGLPPTCKDWKTTILDAVFILSGMVADDEDAPVLKEQFRDKITGKNLGERVREAWNAWHDCDVTSEEEADAAESQATQPNSFGVVDVDESQEDETDGQDGHGTLEEETPSMTAPGLPMTQPTKLAFQAFHRIMSDNLKDVPDHFYVPIPYEVGWSMAVWLRWYQHRTLSGTPQMFKIFYLLLLVLFPEKNFTMFQFNLFSVMEDTQAAYGESIASHLLASYQLYGGFNCKQAGISVTSAFDKNSGPRWQAAKKLAFEHGTLEHIEANFEANEEKLRKLNDQEGKRREDVFEAEWCEIEALLADASHVEEIMEETARLEADCKLMEELLIRVEGEDWDERRE